MALPAVSSRCAALANAAALAAATFAAALAAAARAAAARAAAPRPAPARAAAARPAAAHPPPTNRPPHEGRARRRDGTAPACCHWGRLGRPSFATTTPLPTHAPDCECHARRVGSSWKSRVQQRWQQCRR
jgi:hypothetical protein